MTPGQTRVLVLLLVLLVLEVLISPTVQQTVGSLAKGQLNGAPLWQALKPGAGGVPAAGAGLFGYAVAGLALVALADPAPQLATWLVVLLLLLVVLTHGTAISGAITTAGNGVRALASSGSGSSSAAGSGQPGGGVK